MHDDKYLKTKCIPLSLFSFDKESSFLLSDFFRFWPSGKDIACKTSETEQKITAKLEDNQTSDTSRRLLFVEMWESRVPLGMVIWQPKSKSFISLTRATSCSRTLSSSDRLWMETDCMWKLWAAVFLQVKSPYERHKIDIQKEKCFNKAAAASTKYYNIYKYTLLQKFGIIKISCFIK